MQEDGSSESPLPPLPHPVYFVVQDVEIWRDLFDDPQPPSAEMLVKRFIGANDVWVGQTYVQLKRRGLQVGLVPDFLPGKICVTTYSRLSLTRPPFGCYAVVCQHDRPRPEICDQRIVQNRQNLRSKSDIYIPHWPQPGLRPRDSARGSTIESLVYKGLASNMAGPFRTPGFIGQLRDMGLRLVISERSLSGRDVDWCDYREADVVIAVRNMSVHQLSTKPASKLINAWFADCPALLGVEPAYEYERRSELDFVEIRQPQDVIDTICKLRDQPMLYQAMIQNGRKRRVEFTADSIAHKWREVLAGSVAKQYEYWLGHSAIQRRLGRPVHFIAKAVCHQWNVHRHQSKLNSGAKPFPN